MLEALTPRLTSRFLVASGFYTDEAPPLAGYTELARREEDRWVAILAGIDVPAK
jgi:hypothetical protein